VLVMLAFAANSLLCRLALGAGHIDPASFTGLRLLSGALTLWAIVAVTGRVAQARQGPGWISAVLLFLYAAAFSFAYVRLDVGTGALILFGAVQTTMIVAGLREGQRPNRLEWTGL
jgi:drug/metabolite transporter (DMT)-like permease